MQGVSKVEEMQLVWPRANGRENGYPSIPLRVLENILGGVKCNTPGWGEASIVTVKKASCVDKFSRDKKQQGTGKAETYPGNHDPSFEAGFLLCPALPEVLLLFTALSDHKQD